MSLADTEKKMSKSTPNPKGYIALLDNINVIKNKNNRLLLILKEQ